jgi:hypothetical protein
MNNLEDIVQIVLSAYDKSFVDERNRSHFELELRRLLMQPEFQLKTTKDTQEATSVTIRASPSYTHTTNPPNLMGALNTTDGRQCQWALTNRQCPPPIKPEILHG